MASNIMTIETGIKTFSLNGTYDVSFNPTDTVFIKSVYGAFEKLEALQDKVALAMSKATGIDAFKIAEKANADMTIEIDSLLGVGCCRAVFGEVSLFSLASGMPLWAVFCLARENWSNTRSARRDPMRSRWAYGASVQARFGVALV